MERGKRNQPSGLYKQHVVLPCFTTSVCNTGALERNENEGKKNTLQKYFPMKDDRLFRYTTSVMLGSRCQLGLKIMASHLGESLSSKEQNWVPTAPATNGFSFRRFPLMRKAVWKLQKGQYLNYRLSWNVYSVCHVDSVMSFIWEVNYMCIQYTFISHNLAAWYTCCQIMR